ncbi:MAG TPA: 16S rRNA (guanine(966)-N(2))-methyltransferase RsmD [Aggregatilineaceae bacterium]|jgi:16S rRNA (guanine(966)-N(2))-methyltransferase RsmD|nr:16S rRNA (guanine(966)-N(2))-methyltransferase RsmD [Aggregatilineaceae bacterium]
MPIRVIAGSAKGRKLKMVPGDSTRPVMDRVKEALFNILGAGVRGSSWLDLFAGTGSVGIEALSRGAAHALFIDNDRLAVRTIRENLEHTRLAERAAVLRADAFAYLRRPNPEAFEYIYVAPPQYQGMWKQTLLALDADPAHLQPDGVVIVQIAPVERADMALEVLRPYDERTYGKTLLWFFERPAVEEETEEEMSE